MLWKFFTCFKRGIVTKGFHLEVLGWTVVREPCLPERVWCQISLSVNVFYMSVAICHNLDLSGVCMLLFVKSACLSLTGSDFTRSDAPVFPAGLCSWERRSLNTILSSRTAVCKLPEGIKVTTTTKIISNGWSSFVYKIVAVWIF